MLDINAGIPLVDEPELLKSMLRTVQDAVDVPICIDSSVIEALEAGLSVYEGRALVNSVTAEDERLEEILPLVARYDAAVIGLANDETGHPRDPPEAPGVRAQDRQRRQRPRDRHRRRHHRPAGHDRRRRHRGRHHHPGHDLPDPLTSSASTCAWAPPTSPSACPQRHVLNAGFLPMAMAAGLTSAIMSTAEVCVQAVRAADLLLGHDPWGSSWIAAHRGRRRAAAGGRPPRHERVRPQRRPPEREIEVAPQDGAQRIRLRFLPDGAEVRVPSGTPIFDAASWNGIAIDSTCGGHGTCKKCKVRIVSGDVPMSNVDPRAFNPQELRDGWRLACRANAREDLVVEVPPLQTRPKAALVGVGRHVILRPSVQKRHLVLEEPTMEDQRPDLERVQDALEDLEPYATIELLRTMGGALRRAHFDVTAVVCDQELIELEPGDTTDRRFAIAFDLGTTTVVATLMDLESGQPAAVRSMLNRQQPFGADVITRISATMMDDTALGELRARAHETMATLTDEVLAEAEVDRREVYEITVCGNVTMMQLALGIDPEPLSMAPFVVATHRFPPCHAADFGVSVHPRAPAFVFPSLGAYVGGDIVAGMLATGLTRDRRLRLFIDVGTNSEIALGSVDRVVATAAPAGPAFEAAQIRCGMRAADGAIEGVKIADDAMSARRSSVTPSRSGCAARAWSTPSPSSCSPGCWITRGASSPMRTPPPCTRPWPPG